MTYEVVFSSDLLILEERVIAMTVKGWKPQGGICMTIEKDNTILFAQAMIKEYPSIPSPQHTP